MKKWKKTEVCVACILLFALFCWQQKLIVFAMDKENKEEKTPCTLTLEIPAGSVLLEEKQIPDIPVSIYKLTKEETQTDAGILKEDKKTHTPEKIFPVKNGTGTVTGLEQGSYLVVIEPVTSDSYTYQFVPYVITLSAEKENVCELKAGRSETKEPEKTRPNTFATIAAQSAGMVHNREPVKTDDNLWRLVKGSLGILGSGILLIAFTRNAFSGKKKDSNETGSSI